MEEYKKDCEVLVKKVLKGVLHLHDAKNIIFDNLRLGPPSGPKTPARLAQSFGLHKGKSTTDCVFILYSIISKVLNFGEKYFVYS